MKKKNEKYRKKKINIRIVDNEIKEIMKKRIEER